MYNTVNTEEEKKLSSGSDYERALQAVQAVIDSLPDYSSVHDDALRGLYEEIANRPKFSYDPNGDALYQSYKRSYAQQGRLAMTDTMGQAAGLTGGYGSSYAQSVGQQQYDAYLQKLGEVLPETYGMAYQQYRDEGNALQQQYDMVSQLAEEDYQKYLDRLDTYYRELDYAQERADVAYDRQTREEQTAYDRQQDTLNRQSKEYDRLVDMMLNMGYAPSAEELQAAGMSEKQKNAYLNYYNSLNTAPTGSGGGGGSKKKKSTGKSYEELMGEANRKLAKGQSVETVNGLIAQQVAAGKVDKEIAQQAMIALTQKAYGGGK